MFFEKFINKNQNKFWFLATLIVLIVGIASLVACGNLKGEDAEAAPKTSQEKGEDVDPLPGELVMQTLMEDSIKAVRKNEIIRDMGYILNEYRKKFREEYFSGYFVTDLDKDGFPEMWVRIGHYRENSKLELFYPMADGTLRKSFTTAEPGQYYLGDGYLIQAVTSGPGYININKLTIHNGEMVVETIRQIDLYSDPSASLPEFEEKPIHDISLGNLGPLQASLK